MERTKRHSFCAPIIYYLESRDNTQLPNLPILLPTFRLEDNILLRIATLNVKHEHFHEVTQMVNPDPLTTELITNQNTSPYSGHPGKARPLLQARLEYYWLTMCKDINSFIDKRQTWEEHKGSMGYSSSLKTYPISRESRETILPLTYEKFP